MRKPPPSLTPGMREAERRTLPEGGSVTRRLGADTEGNCPAGGRERDPPVGSGYQRELPFRGRVWRKEEAARAGSVGAPRLSECLPEVSLTFSVVSLPDGGRRVRYGELRSPSCTPFHPPGAPLPWGIAASRVSDSSRLLGKAVRIGSFRHRHPAHRMGHAH